MYKIFLSKYGAGFNEQVWLIFFASLVVIDSSEVFDQRCVYLMLAISDGRILEVAMLQNAELFHTERLLVEVTHNLK